MAHRWGFSRPSESQDEAVASTSTAQYAKNMVSKLKSSTSAASPHRNAAVHFETEDLMSKEVTSLSSRVGLLYANDATRKLQIMELQARAEVAVSTLEAYGSRLSALEASVLCAKEPADSGLKTAIRAESAAMATIAGPIVAVAMARLAGEIRSTIGANTVTLRSEFDEKIEDLYRVLVDAQAVSRQAGFGAGWRAFQVEQLTQSGSNSSSSRIVAPPHLREAISASSPATTEQIENMLSPPLNGPVDSQRFESLFAEGRLDAATDQIVKEIHSRHAGAGLSGDEDCARYVIGLDPRAPSASQHQTKR